MSKPAFTERDVEKAIAGAMKAGLQVGAVEICRSTGRIRILPVASVEAKGDDLEAELEAWRARNGDG